MKNTRTLLIVALVVAILALAAPVFNALKTQNARSAQDVEGSFKLAPTQYINTHVIFLARLSSIIASHTLHCVVFV